MGIALGVMGMTVMEFEEMLLHDFFLKLYYHNLKEEHSYRTTAELVANLDSREYPVVEKGQDQGS